MSVDPVANPVRGEAALRVAGETIVLRPSFSALVAAEAELGPLFALVERAAGGALSLAELVALFWHCRCDVPAAVTREAVGEAVVAGGLAPGDAGAACPARADPGRAVSARFADVAVRLAGFAGVVLGWPPDTFWGATPAELAAMVAVLSGESVPAPLDAATIRRLQEIFPDG